MLKMISWGICMEMRRTSVRVTALSNGQWLSPLKLCRLPHFYVQEALTFKKQFILLAAYGVALVANINY